MRGTYRIYRWLVAVWLMMAGGVLSPVRAYTYATQPSAWRTTPTLSTDIAPSCSFHSTSSYAPIVGATTYTSNTIFEPGASYSPNRMRKSDPWDEDEEDPVDPTDPEIGVVDTPVGSPLVLLLFAGIYIVYRRKNRSKRAIFL